MTDQRTRPGADGRHGATDLRGPMTPRLPQEADPPSQDHGPTERRVAAILLGLALLVGAVLRVRLAITDASIYWPDEIHKTLEPAHRLAFGYGFVPWEFVRGATSWFLPGVLAGVVRTLATIGLDDPRQYVIVMKGLFVAGALAAVVGVALLARTQGGSPVAAGAGAALFALAPQAVFFSHRALTETASLAPVTFGLALTLDPRSSRRRFLLGSLLLVLAVFLRLQNGIFCIGALAALAARRDWKRTTLAGWTFGAGALAFGLFDLVTWGRPFQTAIEYLRFNVLERGSEGWGTSSFGYYLDVLGRPYGPLAVVVGVLVILSVRRAAGLFAITFSFIALHALEPHKEARFVLAALPLLCALAGIGCTVVAGRLSRTRAATLRFPFPAAPVVALVLIAILSAPGHRSLTFSDVGQGDLFDPTASAYTHARSINQLLYAAHDLSDLCGIAVRNEMRVWTGGYVYLHRPVPFYGKDNLPTDPLVYNYEIGAARPNQPGIVTRHGDLALIRLRPPPCSRDPRFSYRLDSG